MRPAPAETMAVFAINDGGAPMGYEQSFAQSDETLADNDEDKECPSRAPTDPILPSFN